MNSVQLIGRLSRDPDVRYTEGGSTVARFTVAVDRRYSKDGGDTADFISCVAFERKAEFIEKWFVKGKKIGINGRIQTGSYTNKEGQKVYTTEVIVENAEFVESKNASADDAAQPHGTSGSGSADSDGFMNIPDDVEDEGLPFN